ncbi:MULTISPECIES: hypothetical protein [unclassified Marinomonas]|nr:MULTISPECIES: hypothetical protein [unclassified Marinomonas]
MGYFLNYSAQYSQVDGFTLVYSWILAAACLAALWCQRMQKAKA